MDEINELIRNDLKDRTWTNHYDSLDLSTQPEYPRVYFLGRLFGVVLFLQEVKNRNPKEIDFSIIINHSADSPESWVLFERDFSNCFSWLGDLTKQLDRAKRWMKEY